MDFTKLLLSHNWSVLKKTDLHIYKNLRTFMTIYHVFWNNRVVLYLPGCPVSFSLKDGEHWIENIEYIFSNFVGVLKLLKELNVKYDFINTSEGVITFRIRKRDVQITLTETDIRGNGAILDDMSQLRCFIEAYLNR